MNRADGLENHDFSTAYATLRLFAAGPMAGQESDIDCGSHGARFKLDCDLSPLFPHINAVARRAQYYEKPDYIKFLLDDHLCGLYPDQGAFAPVRDMAAARTFLATLLAFIIDIARRRVDIAPSYRKFKPASAVDIYRLLPRSNCQQCGFATCLAFAAALSRQHTTLAKCPYLGQPMAVTATFPVYDRQGKLVRTVSVDVEATDLHEKIDGDANRAGPLSPLAADAPDLCANIEAANAALPAPLTRREIQVLRQVARGATNREISASLRISPHTVKSHVIHIFNKLGVNDRAQAAAWGALHGVL